ncbi:MAG: DUF4041 domain-containing protein [Methanocorpusculum sp.]|nr:DUF4041 domain-containing protein [Methanocorpusculum sp.]
MGLFTSKAEKEAMERCRQRKEENEQLKQRVSELEKLISPDYQLIEDLKNKISQSKLELADLIDKTSKQSEELQTIEKEFETRKADLIQLDDEILLQDFGLYHPMYEFSNSDTYKEELARVRERQKDMIRNKTAATCGTNWTVNGSTAKGAKMTADNIKQIIRTFNIECESAIDHVKFNNIDSMKDKIYKSYTSLNKLNESNNISISLDYYKLKDEELHLAVEWAIKKQDEKEELRRVREEQREEAKAARELEERRREIEKEQTHYSNALKKIEAQLQNASAEAAEALEEKRKDIEAEIEDLDKALKDVDYREANIKAGYVYIISNIGSFGDGVFKIGMTRRLDPMERIVELGDASVPFNFDVHALIFCEDAPSLEAALHRAFDSDKLNKINTRREFFKVSLADIKRVVKENYDKTVDFVEIPPAEQYRQSLLLKS